MGLFIKIGQNLNIIAVIEYKVQFINIYINIPIEINSIIIIIYILIVEYSNFNLIFKRLFKYKSRIRTTNNNNRLVITKIFLKNKKIILIF